MKKKANPIQKVDKLIDLLDQLDYCWDAFYGMDAQIPPQYTKYRKQTKAMLKFFEGESDKTYRALLKAEKELGALK
mgnify:CR=1 FL=1